jgi:hypothetical protein
MINGIVAVDNTKVLYQVDLDSSNFNKYYCQMFYISKDGRLSNLG